MRKFLATMLAVVMILCAMLCASACGGAKAPAPSDPDTSTDPSGNENGGGNGNDNNDDDNDDNDDEEYSAILKNVLTNYDDIIQTRGYEGNIGGPIPYRFLQSQGHDINAYKTNKLICSCISYVKDNDKNTLYMSVKAENEHPNGNYYTNYVLSYSISDKEYDEVYMLHEHHYIQAPLYIQELDKQRTPKIETVTKIEVSTYDKLQEGNNKAEKIEQVYGSKTSITFDLIEITDATHITLAIRESRSNNKMLIKDCHLRNLKLRLYDIAASSLNNGILKAIDPGASTITNFDEYQSNYESFTYFNSQQIIAFLHDAMYFQG